MKVFKYIFYPIVFMTGIAFSAMTAYSAVEDDTTNPNNKLPYSVQAGAYLQKNNADRISELLKGRGYKSYIYETYNSKRQHLYILRIGDYKVIEQAISAAKQFTNLEKMPVIITKSDSITPIQYNRHSTASNKLVRKVITTAELAKIDGRAGTIISPDELSQIDGQTGIIMDSDELAKIDAQQGTIIRPEELATIDAQTGSVIQTEELATIDAQTGSVIPTKELSEVDGQATTKMASEDMATIDGQTGALIPRGDLSGINAQAAGTDFAKEKSEPTIEASGGPDGEIELESFGDEFDEFGDEKLEGTAAKQLREEINRLEEKINELREEADVRKILEITEEEKEAEEDQILSATGRDYTMAPKGSIGFDYGFGYTHNSPDTLSYLDTYPKVEHKNQHTLTNSFSITYALRDNISLSANIPFIYKYDNMGTENSKDVTDLGDISISFRMQPLKAGGKLPPFILSLSTNLVTGRSPYKINPSYEMSTGSGTVSTNFGISMSKKLDPVMAFGSLGYGYSFPVTDLNQNYYGSRLREVKPSHGLSLSSGFGYSISYMLTVNMSLSYSYSFSGERIYDYGSQPTPESASASLSFGTGWALSPKRRINISVSKGLSRDAADFSISASMPFNL